MKAKRESSFSPVTVILENQEEVNAMYALFNHSKVTRAVEISDSSYEHVKPFIDSDGLSAWSALNSAIKK